MKLKKIVSLALAGILAVSMLTACGDNGSSSSSSEPTTPAAGISAKVDALLAQKDKIELTDSTTYNTYLSAAIEDAKLDTTSIPSSGLNTVKTNLLTKFKNNVVNYKQSAVGTFTSAVSDVTDDSYKADGVYAYVAQFDGKMNEDVLVNSIVTALDKNLFTEDILKTTITDSSASKVYDCKYTGSVSVEKVTDGSVSSWYVLVVLNIDSTATDSSSI